MYDATQRLPALSDAAKGSPSKGGSEAKTESKARTGKVACDDDRDVVVSDVGDGDGGS